MTHFIGAEAERELVVAVDMSGSMTDAMPTCRDAVKRFLATLRPIDHATLLAFNDWVFTAARREASPEARLRAVDRLRAWGSTAFHDRLKMCVRSLSSTPLDRDGSSGSSVEYSPPSEPSDRANVYVPKYENLLLVWRLRVTWSEL